MYFSMYWIITVYLRFYATHIARNKPLRFSDHNSQVILPTKKPAFAPIIGSLVQANFMLAVLAHILISLPSISQCRDRYNSESYVLTKLTTRHSANT